MRTFIRRGLKPFRFLTLSIASKPNALCAHWGPKPRQHWERRRPRRLLAALIIPTVSWHLPALWLWTALLGLSAFTHSALWAADCVPLTPTSGLTAWWRAESNALDAVTATTYGQLSAGAGFAPGLVGMAFDFDGETGSLKVPNAYSPCLTNHFTIEAWVKARSFAGAPRIVTKERGTSRNIFGFQFWISETQLRANFSSPPQAYNVSYTGSFSTGQWYHVAFTYDRMVARLYVDGQQVAANTIGARTIDYYSTDFRISGDDWGFGSCFNGLIDELTVYDRALTGSELAAIYAAGAGGKCTGPSTPLPVLSIVPAEQGIVLTWPLWATNFLLEWADGLVGSGTGWSDLSVIPVINGNDSRVFLPATATNRFFRLRSP